MTRAFPPRSFGRVYPQVGKITEIVNRRTLQRVIFARAGTLAIPASPGVPLKFKFARELRDYTNRGSLRYVGFCPRSGVQICGVFNVGRSCSSHIPPFASRAFTYAGEIEIAKKPSALARGTVETHLRTGETRRANLTHALPRVILADGPASACIIRVRKPRRMLRSRRSRRKCYNDAIEETERRRAGAPRKYSQVDLVSDNFPRSIHFSARHRRLLLREFPSCASRGGAPTSFAATAEPEGTVFFETPRPRFG